MRIKNDLVKAWEELIYLFEAYWGEILIGFLAVAALAYFLAKTLSHS